MNLALLTTHVDEHEGTEKSAREMMRDIVSIFKSGEISKETLDMLAMLAMEKEIADKFEKIQKTFESKIKKRV